MRTIISLNIPGLEVTDRYFSFLLKQKRVVEQSEYLQHNRVLVLSDNLNNFQGFCKLLLRHKIIDKYLNWIYGEGHLVVLGDIVRPSNQMVDCLWLLYSLEEQACREGGYIHFLRNTTERECSSYNWRYIHPKYAIKKADTKNPTTALYYGNNELWHWLCAKNGIEKIGNNLFVHNSILAQLSDSSRALSEINELVRIGDTNNAICPQQALFFGEEASINTILNRFDADTIVTNQSNDGDVCVFFDGKIITVSIDYINTKPEVLIIGKKNFYKKGVDSQRRRIK